VQKDISTDKHTINWQTFVRVQLKFAFIICPFVFTKKPHDESNVSHLLLVFIHWLR